MPIKNVCHVCGGGGGGGGSKFLPLYTSTLLLDRVSQNTFFLHECYNTTTIV